MPRIFISYSRKDIDAANYIAEELKQRGAEVFVDYLQLRAGKDFPAQLAMAVEQSDAVVLLFSQYSATSKWVRAEIQFAYDRDKPIIPVQIDATHIPHSFFFLMAVERVDFTRWLTDKQVQPAIMKLAAALELPIEFTQAPSVVESPPVGAVRESPLQTAAPQNNTPPVTLPDLSSILPPPFEWCWIPAGKVKLEAGGYIPDGGETFEVPAFAIATYPVTNSQCDVFVQANDGYRDADWWGYSDDAKAWRKEHNQPQGPAFNGVGDHPRANVTWYQAVAFCRWLTETVGAQHAVPVYINLPTEQQWQRAAQGDDGRIYPWGNDADLTRCNGAFNGIGKTTPVTQYPNGVSPYEVMDMVGNVREWCLTDYENGDTDLNRLSQYRVLRGGSYSDNFKFARCASRYGVPPYNSDSLSGFRIVCNLLTT